VSLLALELRTPPSLATRSRFRSALFPLPFLYLSFYGSDRVVVDFFPPIHYLPPGRLSGSVLSFQMFVHAGVWLMLCCAPLRDLVKVSLYKDDSEVQAGLLLTCFFFFFFASPSLTSLTLGLLLDRSYDILRVDPPPLSEISASFPIPSKPLSSAFFPFPFPNLTLPPRIGGLLRSYRHIRFHRFVTPS